MCCCMSESKKRYGVNVEQTNLQRNNIVKFKKRNFGDIFSSSYDRQIMNIYNPVYNSKIDRRQNFI